MSTLYHYCDSAAFISIIESKSVWLSSLSLSNDSLEGKIVSRIITEDRLDHALLSILEACIATVEISFDGMGFCLSEEGNLLSQWRGYANNASGVSIGFSKPYLAKLAELQKSSTVILKQVEYNSDAQSNLLAPTYNELKRLINAKNLRIPTLGTLLTPKTDEEINAERNTFDTAILEVVLKMFRLTDKLFLLKSYDFREEREWRLLSMIFNDIHAQRYYRAAPGRIVPYIKTELIDLGIPIIDEVILGPRHQTPPEIINSMLKRNGFKDAYVHRSDTSYR